jgi:predicted AAA+ superfamily ATPase
MTQNPLFQREDVQTIRARLDEPRRFVQVVSGPRQVGKTTVVSQVMKATNRPVVFASADEPTLEGASWIHAQWERGRLAARAHGSAVLALDEVQKVPGWSEAVKRLWDEDTRLGLDLRVVLLGSAPLLVQQGLSESLAGRFEQIRMTHWSWPEMRDAFGWDVETWVQFGGYPGAAPLIGDPDRWRRYILDAIVETSVGRDVLLLTRVDRPALLRRLFALACAYSGQELSYQKMVGQLQDAGNTTTLAHYLDLLEGAGLVAGLDKHAGDVARRRGSSPKLLALNTALVSATSGRAPGDVRRDPQAWGRLVETAVGAHLFALAQRSRAGLRWWRHRDREVDFVLTRGERTLAIEVKSGRPRHTRSGLETFQAAFGNVPVLVVGSGGMPLAEFLETPLDVLAG